MANLGNFFIHTGWLTVSSFVAQAFGLAAVVVISKNFSQSAFGEYSVFLSHATMVAIGGSLSYDLSFPNIEEEDVAVLGTTILLVSLVSCAFVGLAYAMAGYPFALELTLCSFSLALVKSCVTASLRYRRFLDVGVSRVMPFAFLLLAALVLARCNVQDVRWLVWCQTSAALGTCCWYVIGPQRSVWLQGCHFSRVRRLLVSERRWPLLVTPAELFNSAAYNLPTILISRLFGAAVAGQYGLVLRFCFGPLGVLGNTIGQVFHAELAHCRRERMHGRPANYPLIRFYLAVIGGAAAVSILFGFPLAVHVYYGDEWSMASTFARYLSPLFGLMLFVSPLAKAFYVYEFQRYEFFSQAAYLAVSLSSFFVAAITGDVFLGVGLFSFLACVRYGVMYWKVETVLAGQEPSRGCN